MRTRRCDVCGSQVPESDVTESERTGRALCRSCFVADLEEGWRRLGLPVEPVTVPDVDHSEILEMRRGTPRRVPLAQELGRIEAMRAAGGGMP